MAGNCSEGLGDDFFEQILAVPSAYTNGSEASSIGYGNGRTVGDVGPMTMPMVLQLGCTSGGGGGDGSGGGGLRGSLGIGVDMPLGLNLEQGFLRHQDTTRPVGDAVVNVEGSSNNHQHHRRLNNNYSTTSSSSSIAGITDRDSMHMRGMFSAFGQLHAHSMRPTLPSPAQTQLHLRHHRHQQQQQEPFHSQPPTPAVSTATLQQPQPQPPGIRPRVRARRGQATDPHSIAERLRRERIAERMKALQELVPKINKTDRAAMLDEIVDYVKFLRLQVKVLSMSRLGGAGAVAQLVADVPPSAVEGEGIEDGANQQGWDKWSNDGTEQQVAKLMEEDVGAAMQFLQSKALCIMPISLASAIFRMPVPQSEAPTPIKPESNTQSQK